MDRYEAPGSARAKNGLAARDLNRGVERDIGFIDTRMRRQRGEVNYVRR